MKRRSSQQNLVYFLVPLLIAIQIGTLILTVLANRNIATDTLNSQLLSGTEVFRRVGAQRSVYLRLAAELASKDFGLISTIANHARATTDSSLRNQLDRTGADIAVLTDLNGQVIGNSVMHLGDDAGSQPGLSDESLAAQAANTLPGNINIFPLRIAPARNVLFKWVKVAIRAPQPVAYLTFGFVINDSIAAQFKRLTDLDFLFVSQRSNGTWTVHATSFDADVQAAMGKRFDTLQEGFWTVSAEGEDHRMLAIDIDGPGKAQVYVVVGKSVGAAMQPFHKQEVIFGALLACSIVLSIFATYRVTHRIVAPLDVVVYQDGMTGLANRRLFEMNLKLASQNLETLGTGYALMLMDLNKFKAVNDTYGHAAGDEVLREAARRMKGEMREADTLARLGGDEFAVLLVTGDRGLATEVAQQLIERVKQPITLSTGQVVDVGVSIGIAMAPANGRVGSEVLHLADEAMYVAKAGKTGYAFTGTDAA